MKNRDFTQWFIDELAKEEIDFFVSYSSYSDELKITVWNKTNPNSKDFNVQAKAGIKQLIDVYNGITRFIKEINNE